MKDQVILVTGANGGLGMSVTRALLAEDAQVGGVSRRISQSHFPKDRFTAIQSDIVSVESAEKVVDEVLSGFGRLDALVHLVGGFAGGSTLAETDQATFQQMFEINTNAVFYMLRAVLAQMRKQGHGRIVAIGSRAAADPGPGVGAYSASKAAMV